jgi:ActR/RegA family two-component response regulator/GGDEF domain-containing protein
MADKILFVDDEPLVLDGYMRLLHREFEVDTALGGEQGLAEIQGSGPYAVVISDMRMPGMNGAEFLARVRQKAPDTVRMLLTGFADIDAAIHAVNEGNIFRYLTKPCDRETLVKAINMGLAQYRSVIAEKKLVRKAEIIERATSGRNTDDICQWDNGDGPTGLPGPSQARSHLAPLVGNDPQCYVVMFKIPMVQTIEERYGEEIAGGFLNSAAQRLVQGLRPEDRLFHWGRYVLMAAARRRISPTAFRMEITRLTSATREHAMEVNGKSIITTCPIAFDLLPVSQFSTLDDMLTAFAARATQADMIGRI